MPKRSTASSITVSPPIRGINTRDSISNKHPSYCDDAENMISKNGGVELRDGSSVFVSSQSSYLMGVGIKTTEEYLIAKTLSITSTFFTEYNASGASSGTAGAFAGPPAENFVNYKSELWTAYYFLSATLYFIRFAGAGTFNTITTTITTAPNTLWTYRSRLYWSTKDTALMYYSAVDSFPATAPASDSSYSVAALLEYGGSILFGTSLSRGTSQNADYNVVVSTTGEILAFTGEYPGSATWSLIGRYKIQRPLGPRAYVKYGRDVLIMTLNGIVSLSSILEGAIGEYKGDQARSLFQEGQYADGSLSGQLSNLYAATGVWCPKLNLVIFNIPTSISSTTFDDITTMQIVWDTQNDSWWKWTGLTIYSLAIFNDDVYFGTTNSRIFKLTGDFDEDPANLGSAKSRDMSLKCAYNYFGDRVTAKQFTELRPVLKMSEGLQLTMDVDVDYNDVSPTSTVTDLSDTSYKLYLPTIGVSGIGRAASIRIDQTVTTKKFRLEAIDVLWNDGDV